MEDEPMDIFPEIGEPCPFCEKGTIVKEENEYTCDLGCGYTSIEII